MSKSPLKRVFNYLRRPGEGHLKYTSIVGITHRRGISTLSISGCVAIAPPAVGPKPAHSICMILEL